MTEFNNIFFEHLHPHPLEWNKKRELYDCEACKKIGHGPSYDCNQCKLKFHGDCAIAPAKLRHSFFPTTYLHHIIAAAAGCSDQPKNCTACGSPIQGAAYGSKTSCVYFHPCCAMMPICVQKLNMVLIREAPSDPGTKACGICDEAFDSRPWVYFFQATGRHAHVSCVMYEQGHAMNLVDSNLPFDNPDPVNNNIDGQMRLLNMAMDNMDPPTFTPHPWGPQELQSRSVPPSEGSRNNSARWVPMQHPAGPQYHGVPYLHGHGHGHGLPNWNSSAPHAVQPGVGFDWPAPQNYWAQAPLPGMSAGSIAPMMPPPPFNVAYTGSTWGSAPYAWTPPAPLPYYPHAGAGWNSTTQIPPGGQAPYAWTPPAHLPYYYPHAGAGWNATTQVPPVGGQALYASPPPNNAADNSILGTITKWGFKLAMLGMGTADLVTD